MKLSLAKDLTHLKEEAKKLIDERAEKARGRYITLGAGQSMVYDQKRTEAEAFMANENVSPAEIPHLVSEASRNGITVFEQAVIFLSMRQQWLNISPIIEDKRLAAKDAVDAAVNPAQIEAATIIDWSDLPN